MVTTVLHFLAGLAVLATLTPFSRRSEWWIRLWDFPRLQVAAFSAAVAAGLLGLAPGGEPVTIVSLSALLLCLLYQLFVILPYTRLWPLELAALKSPQPGRVLSLVVANVLMDNRDDERLFSQLREVAPDVILALETDEWWCSRLSAFAHDYPFKVAYPLDNTYGIFLASRLELIEPKVRFLLKEDVPSIRCGIRLTSGEVVEFFAVHPEPPAPGEAETAIDRDAELVLVGREIAEEGRPSIVAGDLNDVAWSHTSRRFCRLSRMLDPRVGRGFFNSFHASYSLLRWPLDHVFVSREFALVDMRRLAAFGSDHFPIFVALAHAPAMAGKHDVPEPDADDREEARETLRNARAAGVGTEGPGGSAAGPPSPVDSPAVARL